MTEDARTAVVLLWHLHQPEYRAGGAPLQPWSYLHGLRGYADMAAHLEAVSGARAVVNFSPVLLDQLLDCAQDARDVLAGAPARVEPLLAALAADPPPAAREAVIGACLRAHPHHGYGRFPEYARLANQAAAARQQGAQAVAGLPAELITDLVVWYHLLWMGEHARRNDARVTALMMLGGGYGPRQRRALLELVADTLGGLLPRYAALAHSGRVELSATPYFHPLLPLLLDFDSAREASPEIEVPAQNYPGGGERARWHLQAARQRFEDLFGVAPRGCWPSEGALSDAALDAIRAAGFAWTAGGEAQWAASLERHQLPPATPRGLRVRGLDCWFRDDGLSDRIGFVYKDWAPADAVADLVAHLERSAQERREPAILLALDGENPWEWYRDLGIDFVRGLYTALATHPRLRLATMSEVLDGRTLPPARGVVAGSWVHGQLTTWIGHPDKNRAWEMLIAAKRAYDRTPNPSAEAQRALGACEGSDWMWWPGAHNPSAAVLDFDALLRAHLRELYRALGLTAPPELAHSWVTLSNESGAALGAMLPST